MSIIVRTPRVEEKPALIDIWKSVFGSIGIESFFRLFFDSELCIITDSDGSLSSMGYLIPAGDIVFDSTTLRCAMIYSVATLPEYRGQGLGTAVVNRLIDLAHELGFQAVVLCPSSDDLFEYYSKNTRLRDWFYVREQVFTEQAVKKSPVNTGMQQLSGISANEFHTMRENLLEGVIHIRQDVRIWEYQLMLCSELGGGLFRIGDSCAVVERQPDGDVWIKELLTPGCNMNNSTSGADTADIVASVAHSFPSQKYIVRSPLLLNGDGRRFGMIASNDSSNMIFNKNDAAPWYGMAFD